MVYNFFLLFSPGLSEWLCQTETSSLLLPQQRHGDLTAAKFPALSHKQAEFSKPFPACTMFWNKSITSKGNNCIGVESLGLCFIFWCKWSQRCGIGSLYDASHGIMHSLHFSKAQWFGITVVKEFILNALLKTNSKLLGFFFFGGCWVLFLIRFFKSKGYSCNKLVLICLQMGLPARKGCFSGALTFRAPLKDTRDRKTIDAVRFPRLNSSL